MARNTEESLAHALGRRAAQVLLVGAMAATPLALSTGIASADTDWDELAQCESGGDWNINTGNGFGGGLQFTDSTWKAFGGSGDPEDAGRAEQIQVAERVKAEQGMGAWPTCSKKTGNTDSSANSEDSGASEASSESSSSASDDSAAETEGIAATTPAQPAAPGTAYTVASGDTLSAIAAAHGTSVASLTQNNALADPDTIAPGQQLKVG
ncbi:transglycosylase family protein [Actinomycetospora sp. CA-101289]|uniref:LysM peptidoglycan-binding domain-containing protein n=1 Tax=Actinomycetospora sp. CA-101289 TaxID=3239893 RepID=UPI003D95E37C